MRRPLVTARSHARRPTTRARSFSPAPARRRTAGRIAPTTCVPTVPCPMSSTHLGHWDSGDGGVDAAAFLADASAFGESCEVAARVGELERVADGLRCHAGWVFAHEVEDVERAVYESGCVAD